MADIFPLLTDSPLSRLSVTSAEIEKSFPLRCEEAQPLQGCVELAHHIHHLVWVSKKKGLVLLDEVEIDFGNVGLKKLKKSSCSQYLIVKRSLMTCFLRQLFNSSSNTVTFCFAMACSKDRPLAFNFEVFFMK
ncbi:hypothetical protein J6590_039090 [Homalodisca vitripennis]|nr:hypothetical protein J6590_039090 [Homalodisca vitripennis]